MNTTVRTSLALVLSLSTGAAGAAPQFVNALQIDGTTLDASGGALVNDGRLGFFSDLYYDTARGEWWALSDRGPGGGTLNYATRLHRFTIDIDPASGAISNFQVVQTIVFREGNSELNGFSPAEGGPLGEAFDPEGVVVNPKNGHFIVSDEYGPSVLEINKAGQVVHRYDTPANLIPRDASGIPNFASDTGNTAGKRTNRGFEGLAISPDGSTVFAMLQSAMLDEGAGNGTLNRIVAFDTKTRAAIGQYAYKMEGSSQGRGVSALVALSDHEFLVLERNNRGLGVDGELATANKKVYRIDLSGATDVSGLDLDAPGVTFTAVSKVISPWVDLVGASTMASPSMAAFNGVPPEKWEGIAIGPRLSDGSYVFLAGTDNDYSVTQNGSPVQLDVYWRPAGPSVERIQCTIGTFSNCTFVGPTGALGGSVPSGYDYTGFRLIPGVLQSYKVPAADLVGYTSPSGKQNGK